MLALAAGLVGAVLAASLAVVFAPELGRLRERLVVRGGPMTGTWRQTCPASTHKPYERIDQIEVHHKRSGRLVAIGHRVQPVDEQRTWRFEGHVSGTVLVAVFAPRKGSLDQSSFGVLFLHLDTTTSPPKWTGGYVRPGSDAAVWGGGENVPTHQLVWERFQH